MAPGYKLNLVHGKDAIKMLLDLASPDNRVLIESELAPNVRLCLCWQCCCFASEFRPHVLVGVQRSHGGEQEERSHQGTCISVAACIAREFVTGLGFWFGLS